MRPRLLPLRLLALLVALSAGAASAAPPCLDLLLAEDGCVGGESDHGCEESCADDCCNDEGCGSECEDCACCPLRAPATVSNSDVKLPLLHVVARLGQGATQTPASETDGVFRPPRLSA